MHSYAASARGRSWPRCSARPRRLLARARRFDAPVRCRHRFFGGNAIVGGGLPLAAGLAMADRMQGRHAVTACFFGDGAVAEGAFHESMNLAALWKLPVLFCCENNLYAMGTASSAPSRRPTCDGESRVLLRCHRAGGRHGRGGRRGGSAGGRRHVHEAAGRCSWSTGPIASAPTPCSMPSCTGTSARSRHGGSTTRCTPRGAPEGGARTARRRHSSRDEQCRRGRGGRRGGLCRSPPHLEPVEEPDRFVTPGARQP